MRGNTTESGPLSALQRWRFSSGPMVAQHQMMAGLLCDFFRENGPVLLRNPIALCFFQGK